MASIHPHLRFNPCTKCQGTIAYYKDEHGAYTMCFQCGQTADIPASAHEVDIPASAQGAGIPASAQGASAETVRQVITRIREVSGPSYSATKCQISPSCFTCPLPACKHDIAPDRKRAADQERIELMVRNNMTNSQAAESFGVSRNSITNMWARDARRNRAG